jgi:hypothetical protein
LVLRFHEIAEANHRILNPFTEDKLRLLGAVCRLRAGQRLLDLCCGKAEMICTWSRDHGISAVGVDISEVFLAAASGRAAELGVAERVRLVHADASAYRDPGAPYDIVSCIGATWIGGGFGGTIDLMRPMLGDGGLMLIGEPFWSEEPTREEEDAYGEEFTTLVGILDCAEERGAELVEMVAANHDSWDRYEAAKWWTVTRWLRENPNHPDRMGMRDFLETGRRAYLRFGRQKLGWAVFVLQPRWK